MGDILESMKVFFQSCTRMIHFDLTGCMYGDSIVEVAQELADAHSL